MTGRVGRWTGVKKEVVIMLYVLSQTIGCYAANQLPSSDVQQNGMSDNMLNNQRVVVHKDDISEHAEKSQSMVYVKRFQLDVSGIEECLPPPKALLGKYSGRNLAVDESFICLLQKTGISCGNCIFTSAGYCGWYCNN